MHASPSFVAAVAKKVISAVSRPLGSANAFSYSF